MEDNNNNIIIKGLAIILIAILGINVYRTETTKKEMAQLATTVEQLAAQLDSLSNAGAPAGKSHSPSGVSKKDFISLTKTVSSLESKVTTLQGTVDRLSHSQAQSRGLSSTTENTPSGQNISSGSSAVSLRSSSSNVRVSVSAKVKVENRYVSGSTPLPKVTTGPAGIVVINVSMDRVGIVGSVSVNSSTTISDEEILDQCKEAALKTRFAYNPDAPDKSKGTITYTFTAK